MPRDPELDRDIERRLRRLLARVSFRRAVLALVQAHLAAEDDDAEPPGVRAAREHELRR